MSKQYKFNLMRYLSNFFVTLLGWQVELEPDQNEYSTGSLQFIQIEEQQKSKER